MPPQETPPKIGRYQVTRELGRGGMGVVYLARDPFIDRPVAIKTTLTSPPQDGTQKFDLFQKEFFNEARAAGKLTHPHIVSVYDATADGNSCYLVMEYVDGSTLKEHCSGKELLPVDKVVKYIFQCAKALNYAHQHGVIHRDIKPSNIIISKEGMAKISDFGIATMEDVEDIQGRSSLTGSVFYTAPEQIRNEPLTPQADLFALGVVMYELLAGSKPFAADTDVATFFQITNKDPESLTSLRQDLPESLDRIVKRALEKDLNKRYQTGLQLASDISTSFNHVGHLDEEINFEERFNALGKIDFFHDFASTELSEVLKATQWFEYDTGSTIITEGQIEECFYIIVAGEVIVKKHNKSLAVLKRGDCFGEMAYLGKITRTASIEALNKTILMKINATVIDQMSINTQLCFYKVFSKTLIRRLALTSEKFTRSH